MVTNDATILRIKHEILYEVAKLAWNDQLEDGRDDIPYKISPGPQAQYRCCVYKEREIVRQRIRLAEGKCPSDRNTNNVVQVINAACEECPIASTQSPITAVNVWVKPARTPVRLERSVWEIPRRTSTQINVASAESVPRHAHTMRLPIWSARVRRSAQWMRLPTMSVVYV